MRTETELKKTWCPMARGLAVIKQSDVPIAAASVNMGEQSGVGSVMSLCIGLACSQCVDCGPKVEVKESTEPNYPEDFMPKGEGWVFHTSDGFNKGNRWVRKTGEHNVYCGRNIGEALRHELAGLSDMIFNAINNR